MKKNVALVLALVCACTLGITAAFAGGPACSGTKTAAAKSGCTKTCGEGASAFPAMVLMVGDKKFDCCMSAATAAKEAKTNVTYVVDGEKFTCKDSAQAALADAAERYTERFLSVACVADGKVLYCSSSDSCAKSKGTSVSASASATTCSKSKATMVKSEGSGCCKSKGAAMAKMTKEEMEACCKNAKTVKYLVGGRTFDKREDAVAAHAKLLETVKPIHMTYLVDGKEVDCSSKICPQDKKAGKVKYIVNKDKLDCEISARIAIAKAKWEAARDAAEKLAKI